MLLILLHAAALAAGHPPDQALSATAELAPAEPRARLEWRAKLHNNVQLGISGQAGLGRGLYLDGWPVDGGRTLTAQLSASAPLVHQERVQIDLQLDTGPRFLRASEPVGEDLNSSVALAIGLRPLATIAVNDALDVQLGWTARFDLQLAPTPTPDALGQLLLAGAVLHLRPGLDLALRAETGGLYGYGGDGGKYVSRGGLALRWFPGGDDRSFSNF
jgi:hypothetical protein